MSIIESLQFKDELRKIALYIKRDKKSAAVKFVTNLKEQINNLTTSPYKYRKSVYFDDDNIRDMTYYGYTIIYEIKDDNTIIIFTIFNKNLPKISQIQE